MRTAHGLQPHGLNPVPLQKHLSYEIFGENAEAAADYINEQESRMISAGAANEYFSEDYHENMKRFKAEAAEKFGVTFKSLF